MITTTYTCDSCKREIVRTGENKEQLWYVTVLYKEGSEPYISSHNGTRVVQWCRACLERTGLVPLIKTDTSVAFVPRTIEDTIRDIVNEEIDNR